VDEEDICSTEKMTKNGAHSLKNDQNQRIDSFDKEWSERMHPAACDLSLMRNYEDKREKSMTDRDNYLSCHTHNTTGTSLESSTCPR
jgi:hypothetical protein